MHVLYYLYVISRTKPRKESNESLTKRCSSVPDFLSVKDNNSNNKNADSKSFEDKNDNVFIEPSSSIPLSSYRKKFQGILKIYIYIFKI